MIREAPIARADDLYALLKAIESTHQRAGYEPARISPSRQVIRIAGFARQQVVVDPDALDRTPHPPRRRRGCTTTSNRRWTSPSCAPIPSPERSV